ncbi:hypothetical protein PS627_01558 [Pseudomonas fluorescens]|uniref:fimbrial biogenesis chaperone n=1 Tax=Pseudomonas fluorescens TaxID=294 RepID=UPI001259286A|nr:molecular chaperone [Pseudomonas fluorescens]CAG8865639.1 hypothetical protein PS627_01558 [Pseudomonas fluorescens]VVP86927.1 hypothetical protein PS910_02499 [Pseudomonas fluorescens]
MQASARLARVLVGIGFGLIVSQPVEAATSVLIWPIDPVLEAGQKAGALWLENRGTEPSNLQVRVFAWRQGGFEEQFQAQRDIIGSPPVANIAPGQKQLIRLTRTGAAPAGQEQAYRIIIDEIPAAVAAAPLTAGTQAAIRLQMRYSVPLFVYGDGLWGKADPTGGRSNDGVGKPQLSWQPVTVQGRPFVEIRNTGPVHARLTDVVLQQGAQERPLVEGLLGYVLPGASMRWPAPAAISASSALKGRINGQESAEAIRQGR